MAFGGKKAAPFVKGGGRKPTSPKTAKGTMKKGRAKTAKPVGGQAAGAAGGAPKFGTPAWQAKYGKGKKKKGK
jgi:hypothetical protein